MPLPHFTQIKSHYGNDQNQPFEPVYPSLFEITFVLPQILQAQGRDPLMLLENATNITIPEFTRNIGIHTQRFKYSTRAYLSMPEDTHRTFSINMNINMGDAGDIFQWNTLKAWYDLVWNSQTGALHYKRDLVGTVIVNQHDKKGFVIRRVTFHNTQLNGIGDEIGTLDWENNDAIIEKVSANFVSDYWTDEYIDTDNEISLGNVTT